MLKFYANIPFNTKITQGLTVHNMHDEQSKTFNNYNDMINYYDENTQFIDCDSSRIIDKKQTQKMGKLVLTDTVIVYMLAIYDDDVNETTLNYVKINDEILTDINNETNIMVLPSNFSANRIAQIRTTINRKRALNEI